MLSLYYYKNEKDFSNCTKSLYEIKQEWDINTVTWVTQPEIDYGELITECRNLEVNVWEDYNVRNQVRQYVQENKQNLGFMVIPNYDLGGGFLRSSEYDEVEFRPKLTLLISNNLSPVVEITSPKGGEIFNSGGNLDITWTASDDGSISAIALYVSTSNGITWELIDSMADNPGTHTWPLPEVKYKKRHLLKVAAYDNTGKMEYDITDPPFYVDKATSTKAVNLNISDKRIKYHYKSGQQLSLYIPVIENTTVYMADVKGRLIAMLNVKPNTHWYTLDVKITEGAYIISTSSVNRKTSEKIIISQ